MRERVSVIFVGLTLTFSCIDATHSIYVWYDFFRCVMAEGSVCVLWATKHYWDRPKRTHLGYTHIRISNATKKKRRGKQKKNSRQCVQLNTHINRVYSTNPKKIVHRQSETCVAARKGRNTNWVERKYIRSRSTAICESSLDAYAHIFWG